MGIRGKAFDEKIQEKFQDLQINFVNCQNIQ
jgi:hypothetical protein